MTRQRETGRKATAVVERGRNEQEPVELPPPVSVEERLGCVRDWLLAGKSSGDIALVAQQVFGVSRRTAFYYLARARAALTCEALYEGRSYNLRRSQLLRDRLFERLVRLLDGGDLDPTRLRAVAHVVATAGKLLDTRDRSTQDLHVALADGDAEAAEARTAECAARLAPEERCALELEFGTSTALFLVGQASVPALSGEAGRDACPTGVVEAGGAAYPTDGEAGGDACPTIMAAEEDEKFLFGAVQDGRQGDDLARLNASESKDLEHARSG